MATTLKIDFSNIQGQRTPGSRVDVMVILASSKNKEDSIKIEGARVAKIRNIDFSNT